MKILTAALLACGVAVGLPPPAAAEISTNAPPVATTNATAKAKGKPAKTRPAVATKPPESVFCIYRDSPPDEFDIETWAEKMATGRQGVYVKNGAVLVLVRDVCEENDPFRKTKCQFAAYQLLRRHYPDLPAKTSLSSRLLVNDMNADTGNVFIVVFREQDIRALYK